MKAVATYLFVFLMIIVHIGCEIEPYEGMRKGEDVIAQEDPLYEYLGLVAKDPQIGLADVGCVEFIYPFILFQYDETLEYVQQFSVTGNENFVGLLTNLEKGHSIGLSYPIAGTLADGSMVTVSSNEELQASLESCIEQELEIILGNCNAIASECIWKVTERIPAESTYLDSFFKMRADGSVLLTINEEEQHIGTWIFYFIGFDLHLNIHFAPPEANTEENETIFQKEDWNFDWTIDYIDDTVIEISNQEQVSYRLEKICEEANEQVLGTSLKNH